MKKTTQIIFAALLGSLFASGAMADVPDLIPVQGVLSNSDGEFVSGVTNVIFRIYDAESATTPLWVEVQSVAVEGGFFTTYLGDFTALPVEVLGAATELWLGVTVGADPEMNRMQFAAVPFALFCENALGDITPNSISVGGNLVVNSDGEWVGAGMYTAGAGLTLAGTQFAANFGTTATTVAAGNHTHGMMGAGAGIIAFSYNGSGAATVAHANMQGTATSADNSGGTVIQSVGLDGLGHINSLASVNLDSRYSLTSHGHAGVYATASHGHAASDITSGTLTVARGGTGATTFAANNVLVGNGTGAITTVSRNGIDTRAMPHSCVYATNSGYATMAAACGASRYAASGGCQSGSGVSLISSYASNNVGAGPSAGDSITTRDRWSCRFSAAHVDNNVYTLCCLL